MLKKRWPHIGRSLTRTALGISFVLALAHVGLVATATTRGRSARAVARQVDVIEQNLVQLKEIERKDLENVRSQLLKAEAHVASLEASFPEPGGPFDLYRRSFELATETGVEILSVRREALDIQDTVMGEVEIDTFSLQASAGMSECIAFLAKLEQAGLQSIALDNIRIQPAGEVCRFDVLVVGHTSPETP